MGPLSRSLSILSYHRVLPERDPLVPDLVCAGEFETQLRVIGRWFTVLSLGKAVALLRDNALPVRAACITFDDGYADNAAVALPILRRHGIPATFFIASGFLDGGRMWNDTVIEAVRRAEGSALDVAAAHSSPLDIATLESRRSAISQILKQLKYLSFDERQQRADAIAVAAGVELPHNLMMRSEQVLELQRNGMEIGAHTVNHPILARVDDGRAYAEIRDSKQALEKLTGRPIGLFAYPNGKPGTDYLPCHVRMVQELGFDAAVSTAWGVATRDSAPYELPRFTPWDRTPGRFLFRMLHNTLRTTPVLASA